MVCWARLDARAGPVLADDQAAFLVARDFAIRNVIWGVSIDQPHAGNWGLRLPVGVSCTSTCVKASICSVLLGGVDPCVDRRGTNSPVEICGKYPWA